jgi:hypothetical protein
MSPVAIGENHRGAAHSRQWRQTWHGSVETGASASVGRIQGGQSTLEEMRR